MPGSIQRGVCLQIHYDGWSTQFDVWCDSDLCDLHPVGWCQRTGHPLEPPPGQTYRSERDRLVRQTGQTVLQFRRKVIAGQIHSLLSCV